MRIVIALWLRSLKVFIRNKLQTIFTIAMPFFFAYVFSVVFTIDHIENPFGYLLVGVVITNVFQTALMFSSSTITDIVSGYMKEVLVSPAKRIQIALGQLLAAATIAAMQGICVVIVGLFIGLKITSAVTLIAAAGVMLMTGVIFAALGLFLALLVKNSQTFQVVQTAIMMPMLFLCGAYVPISALPTALRAVSYFNPMTYTTAFFRMVILEKTSLSAEQMVLEGLAFRCGNFTVTPWIGMLLVLLLGVLFLVLSSVIFTKVDFSKINRINNSNSESIVL